MAIVLNVKQGIEFDYTITLSDETGDPVDISSASFLMKIRPSLESDTVLAELSTDNGRIALTNNTGQFNVFLEGEITETLPSNSVFDIVMITTDNQGRTRKQLIAEDGKIKTKLYVSR